MKAITGNVISGNYIDAPKRSCKPIDHPTDERIDVTVDGRDYNRAVYQRVIWRNGGESEVVAEFVIVNGTNYEVAEVAEVTKTSVADARADLLDALRAALAIAEDYQGNSEPGTRERREGMYATTAIAAIIGALN